MAYDYCVYVIQIDDDPMHVYVGQTYLTPEERLVQHCTGYKSARSLRNANTLTLRPDIYGQLPRLKSREQALEVESRLADNLRRIGFEVAGGH
jgi:hypothetical protein